MADSIVYVAAEVMNVPPAAIRPAVFASFARAQTFGVTVEGVVNALSAASEVKADRPAEPQEKDPTGRSR